MENDENKAGAINDDKLKRAAAAPESIKNADNHDLLPWEGLPVGHVPEVNGPWAREVRDFVPTTGELLEIARQGQALPSRGHISSGRTRRSR
jgi:hypothetical protein